MSFSSNVKQELCRQPLTKRSAAVAEAYGVLLYCNTFTPSAIRIVTESADFAARLPRLFKKAFGFAFDSEPAEQGGGKLVRLRHVSPPSTSTSARADLRRPDGRSAPET